MQLLSMGFLLVSALLLIWIYLKVTTGSWCSSRVAWLGNSPVTDTISELSVDNPVMSQYAVAVAFSGFCWISPTA